MSTLDEANGSGGSWEALFDELTELQPVERSRRLDELRQSDAALAAKVERLLVADADSTAFFDQPTLGFSDHEADGDPGLPPGTVLGPWRVIRLAGRGGMGEVYLAERADGDFAQQVALKVIKPGMDSRSIVRRFKRERQILAGLDHPNLAHLLDGGTGPDGRPYFALEWVEGRPITEFCRARGLDLGERLRLMQTVCHAVDAAHRRLVVHRDLKPANILVTADGTVKLLDFGVAKLLSEADEGEGQTLTHHGARVLTPAYASPEQILGEPISTATDVYSLGVLLYELITGSLPHQRNQRGLPALASAVEHETVKRPSAVLRRAGGDLRLARLAAPDLDLVVLTALHRDPALRYAGPLALADDLAAFAARRPISARPNELGYRARKFLGRNRVTVAAVAVALAALVGALAVSLHETAQARAAAARAERVKSFLISVFQKSDPTVGNGANLTARDLLSQSAATIDTSLANEPEVQADLFDALARIEDSLGLLDPALTHARRGLALRQTHLAAGDGRIGQSWETLGEVQTSRGTIADGHRSLATGLSILMPAYGAGSVEVAMARRALATNLQGAQNGAEALGLLRQALPVILRVRGENDVESIDTLAELGSILVTNGKFAEAETAMRRAEALYIRTLGPHNVKVAMLQTTLGSLLERVGRLKEARPLLEQAIATERSVLGPHHVTLAGTLVDYGILLLAVGERDGADQAMREALAIFGPDHFGYAQCLRYLGISAMDRERYAEAATLFTKAGEAFRHTLGDGDTQVWRNQANLGFAHYHLGHLKEGRTEMTEAVAHIEKLSGAESYELCLPLKQLGEMLTASGEPAQAVATLRRERGLEVSLFSGTVRRSLAVSDLLLARALLANAAVAAASRDAAGAGSGAARPQLAASDSATATGAAAATGTTTAMAATAAASATGAPATAPPMGGDEMEARKLLDESLAIFLRVDPQHALRGEALLLRGRLALADGNRTLAHDLLATAEPILAASKGAAHPDTLAAHRLLAEV